MRCRGTDTNVTRNSLISLVRRTFDLNMCMTMCASRNLNKTKYNCSKTKSLRRKHDNVCLQEFEQNEIQLFKDEKFKKKACLCFKCESLKSGFQRRINSDIKRWRGQMKLKFSSGKNDIWSETAERVKYCPFYLFLLHICLLAGLANSYIN